MATIPDGVQLSVAQAAIAWDIVQKHALTSLDTDLGSQEKIRKLVNAYIEVFDHIVKGDPMPEPKSR